MDLEKANWFASTDAMSEKEIEDLFDFLEKNAEIAKENGIKIYRIPVLGER